jgi:tetratricopeptide (TPR) repeat protein
MAVTIAAVVAAGWSVFRYWPAGSNEPQPTAGSDVASKHPAQREALVLIDCLLEDFPKNPEALFLRGLLASRWDQKEEAVRCWEACLRVAPGFAAAYACIGQQAMEQGEFEKAIEPLRKAWEIDPKLPELGLSLGEALAKLGRDEEAIPVLERFTALWPNSPRAYLELGEANLRLKSYETAKTCFENAVRLWPLSARGYFGLMTVSGKLGDSQKQREYEAKLAEVKKTAQETLKTSREGDKGESSLWRQLASGYTEVGQFYAAQGQMSEAESLWRKGASVDAEHVPSRKFLMRLYVQGERVEEAFGVLQELRKLEPKNPEHWLSGGALCAAQMRLDEAEADFRKAIELAPKRPDILLALVRLFLQSGHKLPEAVKLARRAVELEPTANNYFFLSMACARTADRPGAMSAIQRAIELDPGNAGYKEAAEKLRQKQ